MRTIHQVGIIGYGQFGSFIHHLLKTYAPHLTVLRYDPLFSSEQSDTLHTVCASDIVFLSVPVRVLQETITHIASLVSPTTLVIDVSTVKEKPVERLQHLRHRCLFLATHPMFGPYSYQKKWSLHWLRLVVCDHNLSDDQYAAICACFRLLQLDTIVMSAQQHDKLLAESLFLTHYLTQTLITAGLVRTEIDTVSFGNLMDVVESVKNDKALFQDVRLYNPYCKKMLERWHAAQHQIENTLAALSGP